MKKSELREIIREELNELKSVRGNKLNENVDDGVIHVQRSIDNVYREIDDAKQEYDSEGNGRAVDMLDKVEILVSKAEAYLKKVK